jgi:AcrR family transcriptional regulator
MSPKVTEEHKENRRLEIMRAAAEVFKRKGYDAVTMQDIIDETGMSRGGVYAYFGSKEELFWALLDQIDDSHAAGYAKLLDRYRNVWEAIEHFLRYQEEEIGNTHRSLSPAIFEFFSSGWRDADRQPFLVERYKRAVREFARFLREGIKRGDFQPLQEPEAIAQFVISFLDGLSVDVLLLGSEVCDYRAQLDSLRLYLQKVLQIDT